MRASIRSAILVIPFLVPTVGWRGANEMMSLQPESKLWIEGSSTIRSFSCKAGEVNAVVQAASANAVTQLLTGDKAVRSVNVTVPSGKLDCGNGTMNEHMMKALKVTEHAGITFHLESYDIARAAEGITGTLNGTLTLGGVTKSISFPARGADEAGALRVLGGYDLKMTDFGLTPPSLMFGRIKVRETVNVKFDLILKS